jgi:K(+)-stimulated pyrophosphate-energized sodium pump
MGFTVVGLGLFGVSSMVLILGMGYSDTHTMQVMSGFGFGASAIALFARVAGGIYTKAADVGADLVGKLEAGIDEDDPHNPAVIADNVGDNVGDVAGMGADLFESYVGSIIAAATLGVGSADKMLLPFFLSAAGVVCAMLGCFAVSTNETGKSGKNTNMAGLMWALEKGMYLAGFLFVGAAAGICAWLKEMKSFGCVIIGLVAGMMIGKGIDFTSSLNSNEHFTGTTSPLH